MQKNSNNNSMAANRLNNDPADKIHQFAEESAPVLKRRPQLVLDVGGVLLSNLTPSFWTEAAARGRAEYAAVRSRYKAEIRDALWSGAVTEQQFWKWIEDICPSVTPEAGQALLMDCLVPLPALEHLQAWSRIADLHVLSNHRHEWLLPKLAGVIGHFRTLTVSSQAGCFKPDAAIYRIAAESIGSDAPILFVDDSAANLKQAESIGWSTLLADAEGDWIRKVGPMLAAMDI